MALHIFKELNGRHRVQLQGCFMACCVSIRIRALACAAHSLGKNSRIIESRMDQAARAKPAETLGQPSIDLFYPEHAMIQQSQPEQHDDCTPYLNAQSTE